MGDLGQIVRLVLFTVVKVTSKSLRFVQEWDIQNEAQIAECLKHSDIVFNLVGRDYETK